MAFPEPLSRAEQQAQQAALLQNLRLTREKAVRITTMPLLHGRITLLGLLVLELLRGLSWWQGNAPGYSVFGMHFLTTMSDLACLGCGVPLFLLGIQGLCVSSGCLGPMVTLVFAMALVDLSALGAYLVVATPRPLPPGARSFLDELEAVIGVWEFTLIASVMLQITLCVCSWRIYKTLRETGLYPPGDLKNVGKYREVSVLEVVCEAEDLELLAECKDKNCGAVTEETIPVVEPQPLAAYGTDYMWSRSTTVPSPHPGDGKNGYSEEVVPQRPPI